MNTKVPANGQIERRSVAPEGEFIGQKGEILVFSIDSLNANKVIEPTKPVDKSTEIVTSTEFHVAELERKVLELDGKLPESSAASTQVIEQPSAEAQTTGPVTEIATTSGGAETQVVIPMTPVRPGIVTWFKNRVIGSTSSAGANTLLNEKKVKGLTMANH